MAESLLDYADRVWRGEADLDEYHDGRWLAEGLCEVADGVALLPAFGNAVVIRAGGGLVLFDTSHERFASRLHAAVRASTDAPVRYAVYSHGHVDHISGVGPFDREAEERGQARPVVVAHERVPERFDRYKLTLGYNEIINQRQFKQAAVRWPREYRYPDVTHRDGMVLTIGDREIQLFHGQGETDDATYAFLPDSRVLCTGDMFIWVAPNAGNPQKVQRYPREWARALRHMAGLGAELLLPGHGVPIRGAERVREALLDTAAYLESLVEQVLELMNRGARLDEIVHAVSPPDSLLGKPYLRARYDEPEFVVRNIWRLYGGWYDGNPAHLKPAADADFAGAVAELAGGAEQLADRARTAAGAGEYRVACQLVELAAQARPDSAEVQRVRADVYGERADREESTMARGVFSWAASESRSWLSGNELLDEVAATATKRWAI